MSEEKDQEIIDFSYACENEDVGKITALFETVCKICDKHYINDKMDNAIVNGNLTVVKCFHNLGVNIDHNHVRKAVLYAHIDILDYFLEINVDINYFYHNKFTLLHYAAQLGHVDVISRLLYTQKCEVNKKGINKITPIFYAVESGKIEIVDLLIAYGANYYHVDSFGNNLLHECLYNDNKDIFLRILSLGVDVNHQNVIGQTPLHIAHKYRKKDLIDLLIKNGADPNIKDSWGQIPQW